MVSKQLDTHTHTYMPIVQSSFDNPFILPIPKLFIEKEILKPKAALFFQRKTNERNQA